MSWGIMAILVHFLEETIFGEIGDNHLWGDTLECH